MFFSGNSPGISDQNLLRTSRWTVTGDCLEAIQVERIALNIQLMQ